MPLRPSGTIVLRGLIAAFCLLAETVGGSPIKADEPVSSQTQQKSDPQREEQIAERDKLLRQSKQLAADGKTAEAIAAGEQVQTMDALLFGQKHPEYAITLNYLAVLYYTMRDYAHAEPLYLQCLDIRKKVPGEDHPEYATTLNSLALLYYAKGDYSRVEPLFLQCQEIKKNSLGENHPGYAQTLNNLAELYSAMGDYARAEPLYLQCQEIERNTIGEDHPEYAITLNNLAALYEAIGDYARAEPLYLQCQAIDRKSRGEDDPEYAITLNNLAGLYKSMGDLKRAEPLYLQCQEIDKKTLGQDHPEYAITLNNLAGLYNSMGDLARAEPLYLQCQEIIRHAYGENHRHYATTLSNLAGLYESMGDDARAEPLYLQCRDIQKKVLGEEHPDFAATLNNLAVLYRGKGEYARAESLFMQAVSFTRIWLSDSASNLSEREQLAMSQMLRHRLDNYMSLALEIEQSHPSAVGESLLWKGATLVRQRRMRLAAEDPDIADHFRELQHVTRHLSSLSQVVPTNGIDTWRRRMTDLIADKETLERRLSRDVAAFLRDAMHEITFEWIQASIPKDAVLIDYLEFSCSRPIEYLGPLESRPSLLAIVVPHSGEARLVDLGDVAPLSDAVDTWRQTFGMSPQGMAAAKKIRQRIWEPLLDHIGNAETVLVSTDGVLGRLPLGALPGKAPETYLLKDHKLAMIPVPQLLPALVNTAGRKALAHDLLLLGDVDYYAQPEQPDGDIQVSPPAIRPRKPWERGSVPDDVRGGSHWRRLSETGTEVAFISDLYTKTFRPSDDAIIDLREAAATETAFREQAGNCMFLHLATHGFFAPAEAKSALSTELIAQRGADRSSLSNEQRHLIGSYSPGQLSGLVFAGANHPPEPSQLATQQSADDGIMTADEIAFLPLNGVQLAVLSACETGLGEVAGGEGLLGLQRAFQVAGVRSTVATLWKVNDPATRRVMQEFYTNYLQKEMSILDALREAQLWALNNPADVPRSKRLEDDTESRRLSPYYWAAFTLSGDWR